MSALKHDTCRASPKGVLSFYQRGERAFESCDRCGYDAPIPRRAPASHELRPRDGGGLLYPKMRGPRGKHAQRGAQ